jgi:nucleoid-associated protein YgaU
MNTIWADRHGVRHDNIASVPDLAAWLRAAELAAASVHVEADDLARARQLRDALRVLGEVTTADRQEAEAPGAEVGTADRQEAEAAGATAADQADSDAAGEADAASEAAISVAVAAVNAIAAAGHAPPRIRARDGQLTADVTPVGPPVAAALSAIAAQAIGLLTDPDSPLRACHAPGCVLYFVRDHPRREWCSAACGNRARAARHYQRHRSTARATVTGTV